METTAQSSIENGAAASSGRGRHVQVWGGGRLTHSQSIFVDGGEDGATGGGRVVPFGCHVGAVSVSGGGAHVGERPGTAWDSPSAGLFFFFFPPIIFCGTACGFAQRSSLLLSPRYAPPPPFAHILSRSRAREHSLSFKRISTPPPLPPHPPLNTHTRIPTRWRTP